MTTKIIALGELRLQCLDHLVRLPDDTEIAFGSGDLSFHRIKTRLYRADDKTPKNIQIEFNELYEVTHDS
ncbi:MAG: hypothetical protein KZQ99_02400 [Candidatus Thiodiazotropha sp. (ex Dulcina madagascariensis)]|nr:hypothetical protein [Candidatus Thiodiazotropha sp. (ex Dulcina madagascariensis)]